MRAGVPVPGRRAEIGNIAVVKSAVTLLGSDDVRTRDRVARALHEHGPQTAAALSMRFGLTPAAVRRHLEALIAAGKVCEVPEPKGRIRHRGRPAKLFALTDLGRSAFPHAYDSLAAAALRYVAQLVGEPGVREFAHRHAAELEGRYATVLAQLDRRERPAALAEALTADGYAASVETVPTGTQICQHHCPIAHVAAEFPQLCEAETQAFARLLDIHVQRLATIAHGDGVCTTHIPAAVQPDGDSRHLPVLTQRPRRTRRRGRRQPTSTQATRPYEKA